MLTYQVWKVYRTEDLSFLDLLLIVIFCNFIVGASDRIMVLHDADTFPYWLSCFKGILDVVVELKEAWKQWVTAS